MKIIAFALALIAIVALDVYAQNPQQVINVDAPGGVTACELEQSKDNGTTWAVMTPQSVPSANQCTFTVVPPDGRSLYRWAYISGTSRTLRSNAGVYLCAKLPDCSQIVPTNVGVK